MIELGNVYDLEQYGICRCTNTAYYDNMHLYEMQNIDDDSYIIINEYGEPYGEGSFDDWNIM